MYPVGVLFGLGEPLLFNLHDLISVDIFEYSKGFDTASSIALLAVSALAKKDGRGKGIPTASIIILPVSMMSLDCTVKQV